MKSELQTLRKSLKDIGFSNGESSVYLASLELGQSKVGRIIKESGISRSKVYDILEKLVKKGTISKIKKNDILFYEALPPESLLRYLREKEKSLEEDVKTLKNILPQLSALSPKKEIEIKVYEGADGFKSVINKTIKELRRKDEYLAMGISKTTEFMRNYALKIYLAQKEKKFLARSIFDEEGSYKIAERKSKKHKIRILPKSWHTPALFTIYQDTIGIHLGNENKIVSIVIKSEEITKSFKTTFEAMWKISKEA